VSDVVELQVYYDVCYHNIMPTEIVSNWILKMNNVEIVCITIVRSFSDYMAA
jgi:hypothetical protein